MVQSTMPTKPTDFRVVDSALYFLPVETRVPLKFGPETVTHVTCARVAVTCQDRSGNREVGWGETPLSVQWVWPSHLPYDDRHAALKEFCLHLADDWLAEANRSTEGGFGDVMEVCHAFLEGNLQRRLADVNARRSHDDVPPMPYLAALVCASAFDLAIHDAFGKLCHRSTYACYTPEFLNRDLAAYLTAEQPPQQTGRIEGDVGGSASGTNSFANQFPADYLVTPPSKLPAWHLVGGLDALDESELDGSEPNDGYPVTLVDWIERDGLTCLKIKLRGNDAEWDYQRIVRVAQIGLAANVAWLTTDFNCTVDDPAYVNEVLDRLLRDEPRIYAMILYVEQPFPYDLHTHRIDVRSTSARKPLFMDESAHDWRLVRLGQELGWTGVALKTCKTQTGALLSLCWAKQHGMTLMVQDLTNPMLAQIPHVQLAAYAGTIQGVETNAMQFYPAASSAEAAIHPGIYERRDGVVDLSSLDGPGFGYRLDEIERRLPAPSNAPGT